MPKLTPDKGLKLEPDNTPLSGSMTEDAELIDEILYVSATGAYWYYHYCYGLDLGSSQTVDSIVCRATLSNAPIDWYSSAHDSVTVYKSDDGSTWTEVEQFDGPPIIHAAFMEMAFELEFASSQTARFFKVRNAESSSTLGTTPGGASILVSEIEAYGTGGEQTELEDMSLDLSAYYQSLENIQLFLQVHGIEYRDLRSALAAADWTIEDLAMFLSAWLQGLDDVALDLSTHGFHYEDMKSILAAFFQTAGQDLKTFLEAWATHRGDLPARLEAALTVYKSLQAWLTAYGQEAASFPALLQAARAKLQSFKSFLHAADGLVFGDLGCFFTATDGIVRSDLGLWLCAFSGIPAFRSVTAQRVSSVVHEVT